tara:strand:+ start:2401 stop:3150 length:750 start_codon:yes stop_codon:yes gene_type:complete
MRKKKTELPEAGVTRNSGGLITDDSIKYHFTEDGLIDWRKMVKDCYLYPNPSKNISETDISKLDDRDLCILLGGLKELAQVRGYVSVNYDVVAPSPDYVIATCTITWIPNYETENKEVVYSAIGDSSLNNTTGIGGIYYLATTAENRAFARCIRSFLRINVVSREELAKGFLKPKANDSSSGVSSGAASPASLLEETMKKKGVPFSQIKIKLVEEGIPDAEEMSSVNDIPKDKIFELINRIKKAKSKGV